MFSRVEANHQFWYGPVGSLFLPKRRNFFGILCRSLAVMGAVGALSFSGPCEASASGEKPLTPSTPVEMEQAVKTGFSLQPEAWISEIQIWLGKEPPPGRAGVARGNERRFVLKDLKIAEVEAYDVQYEKKGTYRGINLRDLVGVMKPFPPAVDAILLHMDNGILISVALKDLVEDREIFLATEYQVGGKWTRNFAAVELPQGPKIVFKGNKLIAGRHYHQADSGASTSFSPWLYAGSLVAVELVESRSYYRSMNRADGKATSLGHTIFQGRCWNCHNVRGIGGSYGPDLTRIQDLKDMKGIKKMFLRIAGPQKKKDPVLQHGMPYNRDFTFKESKSLWFWLREMQTGDLAPYQPSYQKTVPWEF